MALQHIRSSTLDKRPQPASLSDGQLAINTNVNAPGVFFKDSNGTLVKVGPTFVGTTAPNSTPGSGGASGNTLGEQWLDTSGTNPVLKIWDGSAWQSEAGEFVNVSGDTMTGALVMDNQQQIRFRETTANGTNYIALQAPASVAFDKTITLPDVTGTIVTTGDTGSVTSTMIADGTIVNADVNASAAIAGTKISPDFGSQNVTTTGTVTGASLIPSSSTVPTNGVYLPAANTVALSTNSSERLRVTDTGLVGIGTSTVDELLHLKGASVASTTLKVESTATASERSSIHFFNGSVSRGRVGGSNDFDGLTLDSSTTESAAAIRFRTGGTSLTTKMTLTSGGSLGIGATSPSTMLQIGNSATAGLSVAMGGVGFQTIFRNSADEDNYITQGATGSTRFRNHNGTEYGRWDSSGRLLVGTSTSTNNIRLSQKLSIVNANADYGGASFTSYSGASNGDLSPILDFQRSRGTTDGSMTVVASGDALGFIVFRGADGTNFVNSASIAAHVDGTPGTNDMPGRLVFSTTADGASSPTERCRIGQAGNFYTFAQTDLMALRTAAGAGTAYTLLEGYHTASSTVSGATKCLSIYTNGNIQNTNNSYGSLSDLKLKENIVDAGSQWSDIKALQVRKYNFKEGQTHTQIGLVAQEVELVSPGLVTESPDRDAEGNDLGTTTKSVNYSVLYMKAVKALQEAMERIEVLEQRLTDAGIA